MSKKHAYIVTGPESSGTTMLRRALVLVGVYENLELWDKTDTPNLNGIGMDIVIHRSIPHGQLWPNLRGLYEHVMSHGFTPRPAVMIREINATTKSQLKRGFVETEEDAHKKIRWALQHVFNSLPAVTPVSYEAFCGSKGFRRWLFCDHWGLPESPIDIWPANGQYYGGLL